MRNNMKKKTISKGLFLLLIIGIVTLASFSLGCAEKKATSPESVNNTSQPAEPVVNVSEQANNTSEESGSVSNLSQTPEPTGNISQSSEQQNSQQTAPADDNAGANSQSSGALGGSSEQDDESTSQQSGSAGESTGNSPQPSDSGSEEDIANIEWQWTGFQQSSSPDDITSVPSPEKYTLTFFSDGTYDVIADCNSGRGTYTQEGNTLSLGPAAMTLMACEEGSMGSEFVSLLSEVKSASTENGKLVLYGENTDDRMFFTNKNA